MAVILRATGGEFTLNNRGWVIVLRLAWDLGWRPMGTLPPAYWTEEDERQRGRPWNPADYVTCRGQRIRAQDARSLGTALAAVLDDIPNEPVLTEAMARAVAAPGFPSPLYLEHEGGRRPNHFEALAGPNKAELRGLISVLERGSVEIW
ncbi:MAG: hypothetical protein H6811_00615 [Phycisphaeraceae bacterium]|nr:hypothetical protein [Phycisphaeraceae bacterium]